MADSEEAENSLTGTCDVIEMVDRLAPTYDRRQVMVPHEPGCTKCVLPVLRIVFSISAHTGFVASIGFIVWSRRTELNGTEADKQRNYSLYYIMASLMASLMYIGLLVEAAASETCRWIRSFEPDISADEYIDRMRAARPMIRWHAVCYHYECAQATHPNDSKVGPANINQLRRKEKVVTCTDAEAFTFTGWRDLTRDIKRLFQMPIIRLECSKIFIFRDENSKARYLEQYIQFREHNRRQDEFMEHDEEFTIAGFHAHSTVCSLLPRRPGWLRESVFWLCTVFLLTWPYRLYFSRLSSKVYVVFIKELEV